jgi:FEZ-like protein
MWWTITGNFGNILPIDWSKTYACKMHIPALHLDENKVSLCFVVSILSQQFTLRTPYMASGFLMVWRTPYLGE